MSERNHEGAGPMGDDGREIDEELRFHFDMLVERFERAGFAPREARAEARARFGDPLLVARACGARPPRRRRVGVFVAAVATVLIGGILLAAVVDARILGFDGRAFARLAPYDGVRWNAEDRPEVRVDGEWFVLRTIDGAPVEDVLAFAKRRWPDRWRKRFEEDLVEVMAGMGHPLAGSVDLGVRDAVGEDRTLPDLVLSHEKRQRIWHAAHVSDRPDA